jgi:hypothetical protein
MHQSSRQLKSQKTKAIKHKPKQGRKAEKTEKKNLK